MGTYIRTKYTCLTGSRPDILVKLQSSIHVRKNLSQIAKQQGTMYQALQNGRSGEYRSSGQQGRLEVLSATRYSHVIFNNARGSLGNANASDTHDNVAGNQINNLNSPQTTSKTARDITSASIINISVCWSDCHFVARRKWRPRRIWTIRRHGRRRWKHHVEYVKGSSGAFSTCL